MTPNGKTRLVVIAGYPTGHIKGFSEYEQAIAAQKAGKLVGSDDSAGALFVRMLAADPESGIALRGLEDIVTTLGAASE